MHFEDATIHSIALKVKVQKKNYKLFTENKTQSADTTSISDMKEKFPAKWPPSYDS